MSSPLLRCPGCTVVLPPLLFGPAAYYAAMGAFSRALIPFNARWDKRYKSLHRYDIVDTRGRLTLTVPVSVTHGLDRPLMRSDVKVSRHGEWWKIHLTALESAYGRTPYFEFVIDRFLPLFVDPGGQETAVPVCDFVQQADMAVRAFLGIDTEIRVGLGEAGDAVDMSGFDFRAVEIPPYSQIRADLLGFHGGLSVLDLIFNLGPEAPLYLRRIQPLLGF